MDVHLLRLVAFVLGCIMYIVSEFGQNFEKRYDRRLSTLRPPIAKYKIIDDSN